MATENKQNMKCKFFCETCNYTCSKKFCWEQHLSTRKHTDATKCYINATNKYACVCGKTYKHHPSFYRHKKTCDYIDETPAVNATPDTNLVIQLIKQNEEFKSMLLDQNNKLIEVCKNNNSNVLNQCNINSNNKAFNLNVFLNEDCKDAMNVTQFIDSFNLQLSDFENVGNVGFVNGISDIIIKKLKSLDENERPIHCTDQKRQVLYAKVIDKWEKEGDDNKILRRIIKCVAFKNSKNIQLFRDKYPDCMNWDSKHADRYQILRIESLGGLGNEDVDNENKIIRKIAKEILIDKSL